MAAKRKGARAAKKRSAVSKFNVVNVGHKVWLAGLGALARAQSEGPKVFESLVKEGSAVHERARDSTEEAVKHAYEGVRGAVDARMEAAREKASDTMENIEKIFQSRVQKALRQLGVPTAHEIRALSRKVDELTRSVQALASTKRDSKPREPRVAAAPNQVTT